jgi:hypothetical protein
MMRDIPNKVFLHGVYTPTELHRSAHRLTRTVSVSAALAAMRRGEALHLQYQAGRPLWSLSNGCAVSAEVAGILIKDASVVPVGGALFDGMPGQSWKLGEHQQ